MDLSKVGHLGVVFPTHPQEELDPSDAYRVYLFAHDASVASSPEFYVVPGQTTTATASTTTTTASTTGTSTITEVLSNTTTELTSIFQSTTEISITTSYETMTPVPTSAPSPPPSTSDGHLSNGAIAGLILGLILATVLCGGLLYRFLKQRRQARASRRVVQHFGLQEDRDGTELQNLDTPVQFPRSYPYPSSSVYSVAHMSAQDSNEHVRK